jgi:hypothetical protein
MRMSFRRIQERAAPMLSLAIAVAVLLQTTPGLACPTEVRTYGPFTLRQLTGRILPLDDDHLLPGTPVTFLVREKANEQADPWKVPVQEDGTFYLALPEGSYEFTITVEGFLFTLIGDVTISREASEEASMKIHPPWC